METVTKHRNYIYNDIIIYLDIENRQKWNNLTRDQKNIILCLWTKSRIEHYTRRMSLNKNTREIPVILACPAPMKLSRWINERVDFVYRNVCSSKKYIVPV